jgi:hypothetical protein
MGTSHGFELTTSLQTSLSRPLAHWLGRCLSDHLRLKTLNWPAIMIWGLILIGGPLAWGFLFAAILLALFLPQGGLR